MIPIFCPQYYSFSSITIHCRSLPLITRGEQALLNLEIKKRVDQALIPISTILKFPPLDKYVF